jgi:hypothetical protein
MDTMTLFHALRDFADGLSRGLGLFLTERHNSAETVLSRHRSR